jgi:hypothetical protein
MPNRLGGFISKSNKCHEDCFTKLSAQVIKSLTKKNLSIQDWIYHKSFKPHKEVLGRVHKGFSKSVFIGGTNNFQRGEGKDFILSPKNLPLETNQ